MNKKEKQDLVIILAILVSVVMIVLSWTGIYSYTFTYSNMDIISTETLGLLGILAALFIPQLYSKKMKRKYKEFASGKPVYLRESDEELVFFACYVTDKTELDGHFLKVEKAKKPYESIFRKKIPFLFTDKAYRVELISPKKEA